MKRPANGIEAIGSVSATGYLSQLTEEQLQLLSQRHKTTGDTVATLGKSRLNLTTDHDKGIFMLIDTGGYFPQGAHSLVSKCRQ